jgi:hypothetical protein
MIENPAYLPLLFISYPAVWQKPRYLRIIILINLRVKRLPTDPDTGPGNFGLNARSGGIRWTL